MLSKQKDESVGNFMETLTKFTEELDVAMVNLSDSVRLAPCTLDLDAYKKPSEYSNASHDSEVTVGLEGKIHSVFIFRFGWRMVQANRASLGRERANEKRS